MIYRNKQTSVGSLPKVNKPRTLFEMPIKDVKTSLTHGVLTPFYVREVYPFDSFKVDHSLFIRSDISSKVPLDDILLDTFYFFVPYRILDRENFAKVLGSRDDPLDNNTYTVPQITLANVPSDDVSSQLGFTNTFLFQLPYRLQYAQAGEFQQEDDISAYSIAAYYCIWNEFFRDENLDAKIPFEDLYNNGQFDIGNYYWDSFEVPEDAYLFLNNYGCLGLYQVNKFHDFFTSGMISPQKGETVRIPLGEQAPVVYVPSSLGTISANSAALNIAAYSQGNTFKVGEDAEVRGVHNSSGLTGDFIADLSDATSASINQLRIAFSIQALYEMRGRYGTRYIETLSQWGANVPDDLVDRPVYLGGETLPLSNIPVLSQQSASLGEMSGLGATLVGNFNNKWTKSFLEYGLVIGLACTRVKHVYTQGRDTRIHDYVNDLDFYHWIFANIGYQGTKNKMIYNDPDGGITEDTFNYQEAFGELRTEFDIATGIFSPMSGSAYSDIRELWTYADYYSKQPVFSKEWLKEDVSNVSRTLTGRLIPNASEDYGAQFMCEFKINSKIARVMPAFSEPANLTLRW